MSEEFNQKKDALKERIRAAEENKKKVNGIMQKLAAKYSIGEISYQDYHETVAKTFGKKTPQQWVDYYDSYIEQCGNLLSRFDREGTFNKIKKVGILLVPLILFFVLLFAGYNVYKNVSFTGLTVAVDKEEHSDNVGFEKSGSGSETWTPAFNGILESLKAAGVIEGDGRVRVYLDDTLILDSDNIAVTERAPITGNFITGFSTEGGDESGGESGTGGESGGENGGSGESSSGGDSGGSSNSGGGSNGGDGGSTGGDGSSSGSEGGGDSGTSEGTGDSGNNGESGTGEGENSEGSSSGGDGSGNSGEETGEEAPGEQNETGEGGDGIEGQQENETTGGETEGGGAQGKAIKRFEDICADTCSLDGITKDSYNVRFEIEGEVSIKVDKFTYEILAEGKEKEEKNETEKEVKNETGKNESKIEPIPEVNVTLNISEPPILIKEIPEIKIEANGFVELKLEEYFENADEFFLLQIQNISTTAFDHTIKIQPDENFTGVREAKIIASNKFGTAESNLFNISVEEVSTLPPLLVKEIPEIKIPMNGQAEIKLEEYFFNGDEFFFLQTQNISTTTYDHTIVLQPDQNFTGVREGKIIASNEFGNVESNVFNISIADFNVTDVLNLTLNESGNVSITLLQYKAIINRPTRWIKSVNGSAPEELKDLLVEIPKESENISIIPAQGVDEALADIELFEQEIESSGKNEIISGSVLTGNVAFETDEKKGILTRLWEFITRGGITGRVVDGNNETNDDIIEEEDRKLVNLTDTVLATNASDVNIEYTTSGPIAREEETANGKKVFVSGDDKLNYTEILAFAQIPEVRNVGEESEIKVLWIEQNVFVDFGTADLDGNGKIDYIEWVVPHLSNQTFQIILITKAEHLDENRTTISDIYDEVFALDGNWSETIPETHYVRVTFEQNLTSVNDITIFPRVVNGTPIIEVYEFNQSELIATFENITSNEYNKIYLDGSSGAGLGNRTQDTFDLLILNGSLEFDHIIDPTVTVSSQNGTGTNVTIVPGGNFSRLTIGSNTESLINTSNLFLYYPFDANVSAVTTYDYSTRGLNGTYTNGAYQTSAGIIGGGLFLDGNNDYLELGGDQNIAEGWPQLTISIWIKKGQADFVNTKHLLDKTGAAADTFELFIPGNDRINFRVYNSSGNGLAGDVADVLVSNTNWHHVVGVYNGTAVLVYLDGTVSSATASLRGLTSATANDLNIGARSSPGANNFTGTLDEIMILNYSLSAAEVTALFKNQSSRFFGRGEQIIKNLNVSSLGTENRINITINATMNHDSMINVSVGDVSGDSYTYGNEYNFSNGITYNIPITTPNNISLKFIFYSGNDTTKFISPTLESTIQVDSHAISGGDTTKPVVNLLSPTNGSSVTNSIVYFAAHLSDNVNVSNATLYIWNSTNSLIGTNFTLAGNASITVNASFTLNYTGTFFWNFRAFDDASAPNSAFNNSNFTLSFDQSIPQALLNSPANHSIYSTDVFNLTLNSTVKDDSGTIDVFVYGVSAGNTTNFYKHGLIYQRLGVSNNTDIVYNWTAPVIVPGGNTILLLHLDNRSAYGENQTYAVDFSNYGNNGSAVGDAHPNATGGYLAGGWEFDGRGNGDEISIPDSSLFNLSSITIAAWIYPFEGTTSTAEIVSKDTILSTNGFIFGLDYRTNTTYFDPGNNILNSSDPNVFSRNAWTHVAVAANSSTVNLYVNGALNKSYVGTYLIVNNTNKLVVGGSNGGQLGVSGFNGSLDEVAVYNKALVDSEIKNLYRLNADKYFWKVNVTDSTGNNNESATLDFIVRGTQVVVEDTVSCSELLTHVNTIEYGYTCTDSAYSTCVGLNADLNITSKGVLTLPNTCEIFFNSTAGDGIRSFVVHGILNMNGGNVTALNASNKFNFTTFPEEPITRAGSGNISFANIGRRMNVTDSIINFVRVDIENPIILLNSTDIDTYTIASGGSLTRRFRLNLTVYSGAAPVVDANVTAYNRSRSFIFGLSTGNDGAVYYNLTQYFDSGSGKTPWNNYTFNISKLGYQKNDTSLNITADTALSTSLETFSIITVSSAETPHNIFSRVDDSTIFNNLSDSTRPCRYASTATINVTSTGVLVLESCTLEMNSTADGQYDIEVGGNLRANFSNFTKSGGASSYEFYTTSSSNFVLENSYISFTGKTAANGVRGLVLRTNNITFNNNTLFGAIDANLELFANTAELKNSKFLGGPTTDYNLFVFSNDSKIINSNISGATTSDILIQPNDNLTVLNSNYSTHTLQSGSFLYRDWYVDAFVRDTAGNAIPNASVKFNNRTGTVLISVLTNSSGNIIRQNVTEYSTNNSIRYYQSNYTVNVTKLGYGEEVQSLNLSNSANLTFITLSNPAPSFTIHFLTNASYFNITDFNATLNVTSYDVKSDLADIFIYGVNSTSTSNFYKHGLIAQRIGARNGTQIFYNWTAPVIVPESSTILLLHLDNRSAYGENQTYAVDFSNYGNNGTLVGHARPNMTGGYLAGGWEFDGFGNGDYLNVPHSNLFNVSSMTIAAWIKPYALGSSGYILSKDTVLNTGYYFQFDYSNNRTIFTPGVTEYYSENGSVIKDSWTHVAVTANSTAINFYINGVLNKTYTGSYSLVNTTSAIRIGATQGIGGQPAGFNGTLDEIAMYNRFLSDSEVKDLYRLNANKYFWKVNITDQGAGNSNESETREFTIQGNNAPTINYVEPIAAVSPTENGVTYVTFKFTATDTNGIGDLNGATVRGNFSKIGEELRQNSSCFAVSGESTSVTQNYSCVIDMWYYDSSGSWNVTATIADSSGSAALNTTTIFTYNQLQAIVVAPNSLTWNTFVQGAVNQTATNDPTLINNTGNYNPSAVLVRGFNLHGQTVSSESIGVGNFTVDIETGGSPPAECFGNVLINGTAVSITGATLNRGNNSINDGSSGQEQLYYCFNEVPRLSSQTYSTTYVGGSWQISILAALFGIRRRKKKKSTEELEEIFESALDDKTKSAVQEILDVDAKLRAEHDVSVAELLNFAKKKRLSQLSLEIPIDIFASEISPAEALCKYLKEQKGFSYSEIATLLNRDQRTVWINYRNAAEKNEEFKIKKRTVNISLNILRDRRLSVLESIVHYLRTQNMKNADIARLLNKDPRNVWTLYMRAVRKLRLN